MKQNENNANKYKDILFSRTGRVDIVKMFIFCKAIYRYKTIPITIPSHVIFLWSRTNNPKICMGLLKTLIQPKQF